jgi:hypothetical protein
MASLVDPFTVRSSVNHFKIHSATRSHACVFQSGKGGEREPNRDARREPPIDRRTIRICAGR